MIELYVDIPDEYALEVTNEDAVEMTASDFIISQGRSYIEKWFGAFEEIDQVAQFAHTINLSTGTTFDSKTASTSAQAILATAADGDSVVLDTDTYSYINVFEAYINPVYSAASPTKPYMIGNSYVALQHIAMENIGSASSNARQNRTLAFGHNQILYKNSSGVDTWNIQSYGIYFTVPAVTVSSTTSKTPTIKYNKPAVSMRGSTTYASVGSLGQINSADTNIKYRNTLYRIPKDKSALFNMSDRIKEIITNELF